MLTIQSPHFSNSSKVELLSHVSPTFRNKRIPSAQDNYSYSSNHNLKISKTQSPSKFSQKLKRRKSQYINPSHANHTETIPIGINTPQNNRKKKPSQLNQVNFNISNNSCGKDLLSFNTSNPQNIINQMTYLKNEYKQLKAAYKQLIQQKINNTQQIAKIKEEKRKVEAELQLIIIQNQKMKSKQDLKKSLIQNQKLSQKIKFYEIQIDRIRKQSYKMLEVQRLKGKRLQQILKEREQILISLNHKNEGQYTSCGTNQQDASKLFLLNSVKNKEKQGVQNDNTPNMNPYREKYTEKMKPFEFNGGGVEQSLFISQSKSISNHSQFISISLTSIMQESFCKVEAETNKEKQIIHVPIVVKENLKQINNVRDYKQLKALTQIDTNHTQPKQVNKQIKKQSSEHHQKDHMKKLRKEANQKLQIHIQKMQKKQFPSLKTPINDKKLSNKLKYSKSKKKQKQEEKQNIHFIGKQSFKQFAHKQKENAQTNRKRQKQKHSKRAE